MNSISFLFLLVLLACGPAPEDSNLAEAAKAHDEAMEISSDVSSALDSLQDLQDSLSSEQRIELGELRQALAEWRDLAVEVPGYEHEGHDHDHHHGPNELEGLPSDQVLEIQKELKKQIEVLHAKVEQLSKEQNPGLDDGV